MKNDFFTIFVAVGLVGVCGVLNGCISENIGSQMADAVVTQAVLPPAELALSANAFRQVFKRWPKDYRELSDYAKQSGGDTHAGRYDRVNFTENPDGSLEIYAVGSGVTNRMTLTANESK